MFCIEFLANLWKCSHQSEANPYGFSESIYSIVFSPQVRWKQSPGEDCVHHWAGADDGRFCPKSASIWTSEAFDAQFIVLICALDFRNPSLRIPNFFRHCWANQLESHENTCIAKVLWQLIQDGDNEQDQLSLCTVDTLNFPARAWVIRLGLMNVTYGHGPKVMKMKRRYMCFGLFLDMHRSRAMGFCCRRRQTITTEWSLRRSSGHYYESPGQCILTLWNPRLGYISLHFTRRQERHHAISGVHRFTCLSHAPVEMHVKMPTSLYVWNDGKGY